MPDCRTIIDGSHSGAWNMAVDEVLLERAAETRQPQLRLYTWNPTTLSLGYFQRVAQRQSHPPSQLCPLVRRPSGGGAILHDREITYCLAMPGEHLDGPAVYRRVHAAFVATLGVLGVKAELAAVAPAEQASASFLCFERRAEGDVVVGGHKVIGSAQRRRRGALLQHGSILLQASSAAPKLPGLIGLGAPELDPAEWLVQCKEALARAVGLQLHERPLTEAEAQHATRLARCKYAASEWNEMR